MRWPFVSAVYARKATFTPLAERNVVFLDAAFDWYEPAWRSPTRFSTLIVVLTPRWPMSSVWFEAVLHASNPAYLIAFVDLRAFSNGVRAVRVRYLPTYVTHPNYTVVRAGGRSRKRTIGYAGRRGRVVPIR